MSDIALQKLILDTLKNGDSIYFDPWGAEQFRVSVRKTKDERFESHSFNCDYEVGEDSKNLISHLVKKVKAMFK